MDMERDDHYVFQDNYYKLKDLAIMLKQVDIQDEKLIEYCKDHKIDPNSYLTTFQNSTYVPIIWQCSLLPNRKEFFKWLISNGSNTKLVVDGDSDRIYDILFVCHEKYLKFLVKQNKKLSSTIDKYRQIRTKLVHGNYRRVLLLKRLGLITDNDISISINTVSIFLETTKTMIDRIGLICKTHNDPSEVNAVINKYLVVFDIYIKNIKNPGSELDNVIDILIQYYQHDILVKLLPFTDISVTKKIVIYHEDMDPKTVAVLRILFNDRNYVKTCDVLDIEPDRRCY